MKLRELDDIAKTLAPAFGEVLKDALKRQKHELETEFLARLEEFRKEFTAKLPVLPDIESIATKEFAMQTANRRVSLTADQVRAIAKEEQAEFQQTVLKTLDAIPVPKDGKDGQDGKSVTPEDLHPMLKSMVEEAIAAIPKPENGKDGADGKDGKDGQGVTVEDLRPLIEEQVKAAVAEIPAPADGKDGASVTVEQVVPELEPVLQKMVDKAVNDLPKPQDGKSVTLAEVLPEIEAEIARKMAAIPVPKDGRDGLDAVDVMILPSIDHAKSYPRGTFATHNGGLWKSHSQTDGERGWDCIVRGVGDVHLEQRGERNFVLVYTDTVGAKKEFALSVPTMIYRNIWKEGESYQKGDTVTWGGSLWHCDQDTEGKPGQSEDWTLAAKRGRDAK